MTAGTNGSPHEITTNDIEYARVGDRPLLVRIYRPRDAGIYPAVVDIHGGAWVGGNYLNAAALCEDLCRAGVVVVSVDFRKPPEARYPDTIADVHGAIRWTKAHADELSTRHDLVGAMGLSSGGHQLMTSALRPFDPRYGSLDVTGAEHTDATIRFGILFFAVLDPLARYQRVAINNTFLRDAHHAYWSDENEMAEGSPQRVVEQREFTSLPPILVHQGGRDANLTDDMAERFVDAYRNAGGEAEFHLYPTAPHGYINSEYESDDSRLSVTRTIEFINRNGRIT